MESTPIEPDNPDPDDAVWRALAHPVRRRLLDLLRDGPRSTGALVTQIGGGRHPVIAHLAVLREAELVVTETHGRHRLNYLNPVPIQLIYQRWVAKYEQNWTAALVGLKHAVEQSVTPEHHVTPEYSVTPEHKEHEDVA